MRINRKSMVAALMATPMVLALGTAGVTAASASTHSIRAVHSEESARAAAVTANLVKFDFTVKDLPAHSHLIATYNDGVTPGHVSSAQATSGSIDTVDFLGNALVLYPSGNTALSATVVDQLSVGSQPFSGTAVIPSGASAFLENENTKQIIGLTNGPFSIPTGVSAAHSSD